jgi:hypothetical protein
MTPQTIDSLHDFYLRFKFISRARTAKGFWTKASNPAECGLLAVIGTLSS